jgi:hypothetical protein
MSNCTFMSAPSVLDVSYMGAIVTTHGFVFLPENSRLDASNCSGITVLMGNMATCTLVNCVLGERDGQGTEHTGSVKVYKESTDMTYLPSPIAQAEVVECEFNCLSSLIPLLNFSDLQAKVNMCLDGSSYGEVYMPSGYDGTNRSQFWEYRQLGNLRYAGAGRNRDPSNAGQDAGRILFGTPIDSVRMCTSELVLAPETYSFIALSFGSNSRALHFRTESNGGLNFNMQRLGNKDTLNMLSPSWAYFNNGRLQPPLVDMTLDMEDYGKWNTETCRAAAIQLANPKRSSGMWRNRASQPAADFVSAFPLNAGGQAKGADVQFGFLDIRFNKNMEMQILFEGLFSALSTPEKIDWGLSLSENYALSLSIRSFPNGSMDSDYDFDSLIGIGESNTSKVQIAGDIAENRIEGIVTIDIDNPPAPDTKIDTFMKFVIDLKARTWIPDIEYACVELTTHFPNIATAAFS